MLTIKSRLPRFLEHPARPYIVISLTLAIAFLAGWPAADDYLDSCQQRADLTDQLSKAHEARSRLNDLHEQAAARAEELAAWERRGVAEDNVHRFREQLVELIRESGCRIRQIDLAEPNARPWIKNDHPLKPPRLSAKQQQEKTPFTLRSQTLTLSASGPLAGIQGLLARLHALERLQHTKAVALRLNDTERKELVLELELMLFQLEKKAG